MSHLQARSIALATLSVALAATAVHADRGTISAALAASKSVAAVTFREVHEAYVRVVANESGFRSVADQEGILAAQLASGGGRVKSRAGAGTGFGLDYRRLMASIVAHSPRTFPTGSEFLRMLSPARVARAERQRTYQNRWTSTLKLDCSKPALWDEVRSGPWLGYAKRCPALVKATERMLQGQVERYCNGSIDTWGSFQDRKRKGGPIDQGWPERLCDRPPAGPPDPPTEKCWMLREQRYQDPLANQQLINSTNCALNHFFSRTTTHAVR